MNGEAFPAGELWRLAGRGMRWLSWAYLALGVAVVLDLVRAVGAGSGGSLGHAIEMLLWTAAFLIPTRILARRWEGHADRYRTDRA
jgi:hypothetical protein